MTFLLNLLLHRYYLPCCSFIQYKIMMHFSSFWVLYYLIFSAPLSKSIVSLFIQLRILEIGIYCFSSSCRKTRGMGAARKLRKLRIKQRWADKQFKKSHLGNEWKKPFAGSSHAKGIVLEKM